MKKRLMISMIFIICCLVGSKINGKTQDVIALNIEGDRLLVENLVINGSSYIPMRSFFEKVDAVVKWDPKMQTAVAIKDEKEIRFQKNSSIISINEDYYEIEGSVKIIDGATYIPIRAAGESLDYGVNWKRGSIEIGKNISSDRKSLVSVKKPQIKNIPILIYHSFSTNPKDWNSLIVSPEKFKKDMLAIKGAGYNTILPWELKKHLEEGRNLPPNPIMVTFDDGYRNNYTLAYPILKELNMKATIFIIGSTVGRDTRLDNITRITPHFSWEEAKEMSDSGLISIQPHTYNLHDIKETARGVEKYPEESEAAYLKRFTEDTQRIIDLIENNVGEEAVIFCYPYGRYSKTSEGVLSKMGLLSVTVNEGIASLEKGGMEMNRINVSHQLPQKELLKKIQ